MRGGWQAYVRVGGQLYTKQFPITAPLPVMLAWRYNTKVAHMKPRCAHCQVHCPEVTHGA